MTNNDDLLSREVISPDTPPNTTTTTKSKEKKTPSSVASLSLSSCHKIKIPSRIARQSSQRLDRPAQQADTASYKSVIEQRMKCTRSMSLNHIQQNRSNSLSNLYQQPPPPQREASHFRYNGKVMKSPMSVRRTALNPSRSLSLRGAKQFSVAPPLSQSGSTKYYRRTASISHIPCVPSLLDDLEPNSDNEFDYDDGDGDGDDYGGEDGGDDDDDDDDDDDEDEDDEDDDDMDAVRHHPTSTDRVEQKNHLAAQMRKKQQQLSRRNGEANLRAAYTEVINMSKRQLFEERE